MILKQLCTFCGSKCEITETELSKKSGEKLNRCVKCKAIMDHIPLKLKAEAGGNE